MNVSKIIVITAMVMIALLIFGSPFWMALLVGAVLAAGMGTAAHRKALSGSSRRSLK